MNSMYNVQWCEQSLLCHTLFIGGHRLTSTCDLGNVGHNHLGAHLFYVERNHLGAHLFNVERNHLGAHLLHKVLLASAIFSLGNLRHCIIDTDGGERERERERERETRVRDNFFLKYINHSEARQSRKEIS